MKRRTRRLQQRRSRAFMDRAACLGVSITAFYPDRRHPDVDAIQRWCSRCDVRAECLAYALDGNERGIWGGTTEDQRRTLQGRPPLNRRPTPRTDST